MERGTLPLLPASAVQLRAKTSSGNAKLRLIMPMTGTGFQVAPNSVLGGRATSGLSIAIVYLSRNWEKCWIIAFMVAWAVPLSFGNITRFVAILWRQSAPWHGHRRFLI